MNKKRRFSLFLLSAAIVINLCPMIKSSDASAVAGSQFNAGRIIDDVVFFTPNTMGPDEIQGFLNSKVPVCDTWHSSSDPNNQPPFTCLRDYHQTTPTKSAEAGLCNGFTSSDKMAARIIYEVAQSCGINPQVLLVLLQKEQSLITDTWPWTGQYRSATGYGCPDTAACDSTYYGFFNQIYAAARQFRQYANNPSQFNYRTGRSNYILYNPNSACGGSNIYLQNQATAGLYNYTPYQPNQAALNNLYGSGDGCSSYGNRNFWRTFNDWFGAPVIGAVPSPLYKSSSTQSIYVIAGGKKYLVPSPELLISYGLSRFPAAEVNDTFLDQYPTGDTLTNIAKKSDDTNGILYLFDNGKRYPIDINACAKFPDGSANPNKTWGLDCFNSSVSKSLANELIDLYTVQDINIPPMVIDQQGIVWKMEGGKKRLITDPVFVYVLGGWGSSRWMQNATISQPVGKMLIPDTSLVKFDNSPQIYYLVGEQLYAVPGPNEIAAWGLSGRPSYVFPASYNSSDPLPVSSTSLKVFAKDSNNTPFALLQNGTKASVVSADSNWQSGTSVTLPDYNLTRLPTVALSTIFRSNASGAIFTIQNNKRYNFPTGDDFYYLGYQASQIQPVTQDVESLFTYDGMKLSVGRLFKAPGDARVRYVNALGSSLHVTTYVPGLPYDKLITVDATTDAKYPVTGTY